MSKIYTVNRNKNFLEECTFNDKGRFWELLQYLSNYGNIRKSNRRDSRGLNEEELKELLILSGKRLSQYLNKMNRLSIISYTRDSEGLIKIYINPIYVKAISFKLTKDILNAFKKDILENIDMFIGDINSMEVFDIVKPYLNDYDRQLLSIQLGEDMYNVVHNMVDVKGVYLLYNKSKVVYVGKSKNIKNRVIKHRKDKYFDSVKSIIFKDDGMVNIYEPYLIQKYNPMYNKDLLEKTNFMLPKIKGI